MTTSPPPAPDTNGGQPGQYPGGQPAPGQPAPGQAAPGQYPGGQPPPGQYGQPPQGQPPQGQPAPGQPAPGQYPGGQPPQGQYGQPAPGQYQGQPAPGQSEGLDPKVGGLLAYITWIGGLIILLTQKDRTVRFHGAQSIVFNIALFAIYAVIFIVDLVVILTVGISFSWVLNPIVGLGALVLWIILVIKAYNYEHFKLPVLGDLAEKFVK